MNRKYKTITAILMMMATVVGCSSNDSSNYTVPSNNTTTQPTISTYQPIVNYQTVSIQEYQEEIIEMDEEELITVEFIDSLDIYEGVKYILIQRLELGEVITFGDLVNEGIFEEVSTEQINLIAEIEKQIQIVAEPNSVVTITSSDDELFTINVVELEFEEVIGDSSLIEEETPADEEIAEFEVEEETPADEEEAELEVEEETPADEEVAELEVEEETPADEEVAELEVDEETPADEDVTELEVEEEIPADEEVAELEVEEETPADEEVAELEVEEETPADEEVAELEVEEETPADEDVAELEVEEEIPADEEVAELEVEEETPADEEVAEIEVEEETPADEEEAELEVEEETPADEEVAEIEVEEETPADEDVAELEVEEEAPVDEDVAELEVEEETPADEEVAELEVEEETPAEEVVSYLAENVYYEIIPIANGEGTINVTITNSNYETVNMTIPVTITAPKTVLYVPAQNFELENDITQEFSYIAYPENATVLAVPTEESIFTTSIDGQTIFVTGNTVGESELTFMCLSENFESTNTTIPTSVTPTKTPFTALADDIDVVCLTETVVEFTKNENAQLTFEYSTTELEVVTNEDNFVVTPLIDGTFTLVAHIREDDYLENQVEFTIISTTETLELEVSDNIVLIETDQVAEIGLYVGAEEFELDLVATEGITAEIYDNIIEITATQDGTITINATKEGYHGNTRTIDVWFEKEMIMFDQKDDVVVVEGDAVTTSLVSVNVEECEISTTTTEGITAEYDADTGEISITATENGVVTVYAIKDGYATGRLYIAVTFEEGEVAPVSLMLDTTDATFTDADLSEQAITVFATDDAEISLSSSDGIKVDYVDGQIIISAENSGTITVSATKEGYAMTTSKIVVNYEGTESTPVEEETAPVEEESTPAEEETTPAEEETAPAEEESTPAEEETAPAEEESTPVEEETTPAEEETIPAEEESTPTVEDFANEVIDLVNLARTTMGLQALEYNESLSQTAFLRAEELTESFSHSRPDGTSWSTALIDYNYSNIGENIAMGQKSPESVMTSWLNSEGHRNNILNEKFSEVGIGVYENNGKYYWVQIFGTQK